MIKFKLKIISVVIISFALFPAATFAAKLYLEPSEEEYHQGDVFIEEIRLNTQGEYINTVEIDLSFPKDILEVKDLSRGNSILSLWIKEPSFSNQEGKISFIGGIPAGYQGWDGLLAKIIFKVSDTPLTSEVARIKFLDTSQLLLNDGFGTPADLETEQAVLTILPKESEISEDEWKMELEKDKIPPEPFEAEIHQDMSIFEGKYFLIFSTTDKQTGIDYYEIKEGGKDWEKGKSPYLLEDQTLRSIIKVRAVDKAGNERVVWIKPLKEAKEPFAYWSVILILAVIGVIWWIVKKLKIKNQK
jgi:hypothetical protein